MCRAPQQPSLSSTSTVQPFSVSTRTVAAFTSGSSWSARQPVTSATRCRLSPRAGNTSAWRVPSRAPACCRRKEANGTGGAWRTAPASRRGSSRRLRQPGEQADQAQALLQPQQLEHQPLHRPRRQQRRQAEPAKQPAGRPQLAMGRQHRPGPLENVRVFDARGAGGLAGPAVQALVQVLQHLFLGRQLALQQPLHQIDAPARRVHLDAQLAIGGAGLQAQPAVHAGGHLLEAGRAGRLEQRQQRQAHSPARPRLRMPPGSQDCRTPGTAGGSAPAPASRAADARPADPAGPTSATR